jgi:cytochrome b subunit of formate dehydrogenase
MSTATENITASPETNEADEYYTYVEGVGNIPRDIYKHVKSDPLGDLPRYSIHIVIQHFLTFITFLILAATGLTLHFADLWWAPLVMKIFGGPDLARLIHRIAAALMVLASVYHVLTIIGGTIQKVLQKKLNIYRMQIPTLKDAQDIVHDFKYFLGKERYRPKMHKFMYKQKLHYLAILWGTFVLVTAGTTLLYPEVMATIWPNPEFAQDLARLMHADEAIMAITVIVFWHWSNVHLVPGRFPLQWSFLTGRITREHQIEEHFLEYLYNLDEIPEEKEYMKNLLKAKGFDAN